MRLSVCGGVLFLSFAASGAFAQTLLEAAGNAAAAESADTSSSSAVPSEAATPSSISPHKSKVEDRRRVRPFGAIAVEAKVGTGGVGIDLATPLTGFMNLRGGYQMFDHPLTFTTSGISATGDLTIQNAAASIDIYPFRGSSFHLSPGVTLHNDNHVAAGLLVPGGSAFLLGDDGYTSDPNDPVTGLGRIRFGDSIAPRFTVGWGNMLSHKGGHLSVPFEIGIQYITAPTIDIVLFGSVCDPNGNCGGVNEGTSPQDLKDEITLLEKDLQPLRFYPIVALGISYRFGH